MDKQYWEKQLETAISKYDFDLMKEAVKNGADPDDMILHRAINHDRVDLVEYFCFSPELPNHCEINYKYEVFGDDAPFIYACSQGALKTIKFILTDSRVLSKFNIKKNTNRAFYQACYKYQVGVIDFLLNQKLTKDLCKINKEDFKIIRYLDKENRNYKFESLKEVLEYFIMNLDFTLVKEIEKHIIKHKEMVKPIFEARKLHEELGKSNLKSITSKI